MTRIATIIITISLATSAQVVEKKALTLEGAKKVIAGAEAEAAKNHVGCSIAVVDDGGNLIAFQSIGVAFAVDAFVMITRHQRNLGIRMIDARQDFIARRRVLAHLL